MPDIIVTTPKRRMAEAAREAVEVVVGWLEPKPEVPRDEEPKIS